MTSLWRMALIVAVRRIVSNWKLEVILLFGVMLAVTLMSSEVIFSDMLAEAALRHDLDVAAPEETNFSIRSYSAQDAPPGAAARFSAYQSDLDGYNVGKKSVTSIMTTGTKCRSTLSNICWPT